jgi:hypothetical protein
MPVDDRGMRRGLKEHFNTNSDKSLLYPVLETARTFDKKVAYIRATNWIKDFKIAGVLGSIDFIDIF